MSSQRSPETFLRNLSTASSGVIFQDWTKPTRLSTLPATSTFFSELTSTATFCWEISASIDAPVAQSTSFGWIISGPIIAEKWETPRRAHQASSISDQDLQRCVQEFWAQEIVPNRGEKILSKEEKECENHFRTTHSRDPTRRYIVRLPFSAAPSGYEESRIVAGRMLERTQRRFKRDLTFQTLYVKFMDEYRRLDHMKLNVNTRENSHEIYYLSHHGVLRESSATTKFRVVFNGSQKIISGTSLNETLHPGPKLQQDLVDVISRWRLYAYVFSSDVEKMYRQILVHADDRKFQTILWNDKHDSPPESYQLCTVTYGLACAPYLAIRVLHQLAQDESYKYPLAASVVLKNMYVDDLLGGADSITLACEKAKQTQLLLKVGGFSLHKWMANEDAVLHAVQDRRQVYSEKKFDVHEIPRALDLKWSPSTDSFIFAFSDEAFSEASTTKRTVLSTISRFFDPLGWLAPVIVIGKIFLQTLWSAKLHWDEALPTVLLTQWTTFLNEIKQAQPFHIPRWLGTSPSAHVELHGLSDASRSALAAVVYISVVEEDFTARSTLLTAKTRVAPLKNVSIARLELSAAVLLTQLIEKSPESLEFAEDTPVDLWIDSSVALTWICADPAKWKEFVSNRVAYIQETLPRAMWHHVAGEQNPADAASRGLYPDQLRNQASWWNGPDWLALPSTSWPNSLPCVSADTCLEERTVTAHVTISSDEPWDLIARYSTLERLTRITARLMDAVARFRRRKSETEESSRLTPSQLNEALLFWIRLSQDTHFSSEIGALKRNDEIGRQSPLRRLTPLLDAYGVLRVGGRLQKSALEYDHKHPAIIPRYSKLSQLLIERAHRQTLHGGTQVTLSTLREKFWIIGG